MAKFLDLFKGNDRKEAQKFLDYYDGRQEKYVLSTLKQIRSNQLGQGLQPRHRNLTKMVVDKSGLLFNGRPPVLQVYTGEDQKTIDEEQSQSLMVWLDSADWIEFFTNFDSMVRMLRTGVVLWQYIPSVEGEPARLFPTMLGQHNCAVHVDPISRQINTLVYFTGRGADDQETYRVITPELIQDFVVDKDGTEQITNVEPNPYGRVTATVFHDTNTPREGFWNVVPTDLIEVNEIYNVALSDSEYASMWAKFQTLFTNAKVEAGSEGGMMVPAVIPGEPLPRLVPSTPAAIGGPGKVIEIDTNGVQSPFVEYKGPQPDLMPLSEIVDKWVMDFAADWSVNASMENNGADSGFKLIVREMPNLELRKKRQKMFEAGFHRMFRVIKVVVNTWAPGTFSDDAELFVKFPAIDLPVDQKETEDIWAAKIAGGRASRVDYFMEVKGMTQEEAAAKVAEVLAFNAAQNTPRPPITLRAE